MKEICQMKIAVLMTCHNRREKTMACLRTLLAQAAEGRQLNLAVFLVDDGSTDRTCDMVKEWYQTISSAFIFDLRLIVGTGDLFWAKGMRLAWESAVAEENSRGPFDFYLWLNDDVELKPKAIELVIDDWRMCGDERGVIVGACSKDVEETESSYAATTRHDEQIPPNGRTPQRADGWFNGNFVLVPRKAYEQVGMISGDYTHARADYDYAERLKRERIPFFASSQYIGVCIKDYSQKVNGMGLMKRVTLLWRPGYCNLHDLFLFRFKYYGLLKAVVSCLHMMVIVLRPLGVKKP